MDSNGLGHLSRYWDVFKQLGDREPTTAIEAQAVIENIRAEKGHLDDQAVQEVNTLSRPVRETILRIVELKRETEAAYTTNISEQLYSSKYRFLYELVQNADDSSYQKPTKDGILPYLRFEVTPDALIVETNEDGFQRANIDAICATGKSSKKASGNHDHIGEKGFGFKSVFSVADEVQVQSGLWSFRFSHCRGEDGLGMVTPLDMPPATLPRGVTTRITMQYSDEAQREYLKLVEAIHELPDTIIIFLHRLRAIHIDIIGADGQREKRTLNKSYDAEPLRCTVKISQELSNTITTEECTYLMYRRTKSGMPHHALRKDRSEARIELAFPVDPITQLPKLSTLGQHVFAYLPLQRLPQLQFLIQADFITSASRETVVDCSWNDTLLIGVAQAFVLAVSETFAKPDHHLRYSWLDYLPTKSTEHPWRSLYPNIVNALQTTAVVETLERKQLKVPTQVRDLLPCTLHLGQPIFRDLADEMYISRDYTPRQRIRLQELGLQYMNWSEIVDRLQADLVHLVSRTKTKKPTYTWHVSFAKLFLRAFTSSKEFLTIQQRIRQLALIPLSTPYQWTGAPGATCGGSNKVYFACTGSTAIPETLSLRLLDRNASSNVTRRKFYRALGVEECSKETVFDAIKSAHRAQLLRDPVDHLQFLYHQGYELEDSQSWVQISLTTGKIVQASSVDLYLPSDAEFDMFRLVPPDARFQFLSKATFNAEQPNVRVNDEDWKTWLARITGARYHPPLSSTSMGHHTLASALKAVLKYNPAEFLNTLRAHWDEYQSDAHLVGQELRQCFVPCKSGFAKRLGTTYLLTPEIALGFESIGVSQNALPILSVSDEVLDEVTYRSWKFLEEFGVSSKPNLAFYIKAIKAKAGDEKGTNLDQIAEIYRCIARLATIQDYDNLRKVFDSVEKPKIWDGHQSCWVTRDQCVLDGPDFISFETVLTRSYGKDSLLNNFFAIILDIKSFRIGDVFREVQERGENGVDGTDVSLMNRIYTFLASEASTDENWREVKSAFKDHKLILGENSTWHALSTCLWRSPFALANFQDISSLYPSLENFFVQRLGVKKASPSMLINEIKRMAEESVPPVSQIRTRLVEIGMMLARGSVDCNVSKALATLKEVAFLPKKISGGTIVLVRAADEFSISDHQRYADALADCDVLLDFGVNEVQILHVLFQHVGVTNRYLSTVVKEISTVGPNVTEDAGLSGQLRAKAYALYCCAAKYKSNKALRGDHTLFEQLTQVIINTTDEITTNLVLPLGRSSLRVESDRAVIHHDIVAGSINIYVPDDKRERRACYRSQVPNLLQIILDVGSVATFNISSIVSASLADLDDVLIEQDIPPVEWIEKPVLILLDAPGDESPSTPISAVALSDVTEVPAPRFERLGTITPAATPTHQVRAVSLVSREDTAETVLPEQYLDLVEQIVRRAQHAGSSRGNAGVHTPDAPSNNEGDRHFEHLPTFGRRDTNAFVHDRRIGAAGEAYAFEILSALNLPDFTLENWRSTIRGELSRSVHYANLANWAGRETADIVYLDATGALTRYLRYNSEGAFPHQIHEDRNFVTHPIEYYLEVKSTPGRCGTRFYLSGSQYKRMETMAPGVFEIPEKIYVIMRVFDLMTPDIGMKIFVDPLRFKGLKLDFEADQWFVTAL